MKSIQFTIQSVAEIDQAAWEDLYKQASSANPFYHYAYLRAIEGLPDRFRPDYVITGYNGGKLALIQPVLWRQTLLGGRMEFLKPFYGDNVEPLCRKEDKTLLWNGLLLFILNEIRPDLIAGRSLGQAFTHFLKDSHPSLPLITTKNFVVPYLDLPDNMEAFWELYKSKFRSELKRRIRLAEKEGYVVRTLEPGCVPDNYSFSEGLENLARLYRQRWKDQPEDRYAFSRPVVREFHQRLFEHSHGSQVPHLLEVLHEDKVIGSSYGLRTPYSYIWFLHNFDPWYKSAGMGNLLVYYPLEYAISHGLKWFDFKQGAERYKYDWCQTHHENYQIYIPLSTKGQLLYSQEALGNRLNLGDKMKKGIFKIRKYAEKKFINQF